MSLSHLKSNRAPEDYGKVAVLYGGESAEREVSLNSGEAVYQGLIKSGIDAIKIDPSDNFYQQLISNKIDRVFNVLHGRGGEDGVVQGFLETLKIPYTGSNVVGAAISMNKLLSKQVWRQLGISTAHFEAVEKQDSFGVSEARRLLAKLGPNLFVKPVKEGSSVGMSKVSTPEELVDAVTLAHQYDSEALVESFIAGKEYTVSLVKGVALPSISMQTPREFYDYEAKYQSNETEYFCPSGLSWEEEKRIGEIALRAFTSLGCSGWGRIDFIRDGRDGEFLILEANTVPGMTTSSLVPKAANALNISFEELVLSILDTSFDSK
ncbi:D-alanine--D-alanine ligase [Aliikangiella marina]|uniref:D-alanine--D-alanine ligase n=1 Tax=Aliikangiella marina TaxID=1712262 RepID=A0A545TDI3_9GAMM|nr:D-alanine--D-alanine ligase [Aliikangiella marina]TQV75283.1 D-alanine--D-alanine ligase [Aliikangiella marina]